MVDRFAFGLFGRHVGDSSQNLPLLRHRRRRKLRAAFDGLRFLSQLRQTEIEYFQSAIGSHHDVPGLEITMDDTAFMRGPHRIDEG